MILDQFRLKKDGHSIRRTTECFDMYLIFQHGGFIGDLCCGPICLRFHIVYFVPVNFLFLSFTVVNEIHLFICLAVAQLLKETKYLH